MKVSELASRAGIAPSAIRFYEREGLIPRAVRGGSGYRDYDDTDLCRVRVLTTLRSLGLDLPEAARLAAMCSDGRCDEMAADLLPRIAARRAEAASARAELDHLDAELENLDRSLRLGEAQELLCIQERSDDAADDQVDAGRV